jgi:hypothetical protein
MGKFSIYVSVYKKAICAKLKNKNMLTPGFEPVYFNSTVRWYYALTYSDVSEYG